MKIEVLLATMFYERESADYLNKMNIQTDMIVANQCDHLSNDIISFNNHRIQILSRPDRGVGLNRNLALFSSDADIVIFADNDVCYYDGYAEKVERYYSEHPDADVVIFNFKEKRGDEDFHDINLKNKRAKFKDITKFGAWAITARRNRLLQERISFSLLFGGGAKYSCGEDSLFLRDCYNKGLHIYLCSQTLGEVLHNESTWFFGITEKYLYDKGVLFGSLCPKIYFWALMLHCIKHRKEYREYGNIKTVFVITLKGAKNGRKKEKI